MRKIKDEKNSQIVSLILFYFIFFENVHRYPLVLQAHPSIVQSRVYSSQSLP